MNFLDYQSELKKASYKDNLITLGGMLKKLFHGEFFKRAETLNSFTPPFHIGIASEDALHLITIDWRSAVSSYDFSQSQNLLQNLNDYVKHSESMVVSDEYFNQNADTVGATSLIVAYIKENGNFGGIKKIFTHVFSFSPYPDELKDQQNSFLSPEDLYLSNISLSLYPQEKLEQPYYELEDTPDERSDEPFPQKNAQVQQAESSDVPPTDGVIEFSEEDTILVDEKIDQDGSELSRLPNDNASMVSEAPMPPPLERQEQDIAASNIEAIKTSEEQDIIDKSLTAQNDSELDGSDNSPEEEVSEEGGAKSLWKELVYGSDSSSERLSKVTQILIDNDLYEEITCLNLGYGSLGGVSFGLSGYAEDELNKTLSLFIFDDNLGTDGSYLSKENVRSLLTRLEHVIWFARNNTKLSEHLDLNTEAGGFVFELERRFRENKDYYSRIEFIILSLRDVRSKLAFQEFNFKVYDLNTLYKLYRERSALVVDFKKYPRHSGAPLRALSAGVSEDLVNPYKAYVGAIRGDKLLEIYKEFGQRLLAANVRAFLSIRGGVNKGIQKTIKEEPERFFAYNNGLSLVASELDTEYRNGTYLINSAIDLQIVNGGQTTASLFYAATHEKYKGSLKLDKLFVPFKLVVLPKTKKDEASIETRDIFLQKISRFSNSQNKVSDSDLGTNTEFQIAIKEQSKKEALIFWGENGRRISWYYERVRGSYDVENDFSKRTKNTVGQNFQKLHPKNLKFDKNDLAKWVVSWEMKPYLASKGAQKCFLTLSYAISHLDEPEEDGLVVRNYTFITPKFYQALVAKGVLFRHLDALVGAAEWYKANNSYKINTVEYTLALLRYLIERDYGEEYTLDFLGIWNSQLQYISPEKPKEYRYIPDFDEVLDRLAQYVREVFTCDENKNRDVGELVKLEETWQQIIRKPPKLSWICPSFDKRFCIRRDPSLEFPKTLVFPEGRGKRRTTL